MDLFNVQFESEQTVTDYPSIAKLVLLASFGCLLGLGVFLLSGKETRWFLAPLLTLAGAVFILVVPQKKKVLTAIFVLSFQVDIYIRFFYGHAGSNEGLSLSLVVAAGTVLAGWYYFSRNIRMFSWGGNLRWIIVILFSIMLVSAVTSSERFAGLSTIFTTLQYYFLYWLAFNIPRTQEDFRRIVVLLLIILGTQSIIYVIQSALGITFDFLGNTIAEEDVPRPGGTVSANPAGFVSFIMPALMMASAVAVSKHRRVLGHFAVPLMFMGIAAVGLSFTRAAWVGLIFGFAAIVIIGHRNKWLNIRMITIVGCVAAVGILALLPKMFDRVSSDYGTGGVDGTVESYKERMGLNLIALNVIAHHPLLGVGPGAYPHVFKQYVPAGLNQWLFTVHNVFLLWAAETGIPGGITFIALLFVGIRIAFHLSRGPPTFISICATGWFAAMIVLIWMMFWAAWIGVSYNAMFWFMLGLMDGAQRLVNFEKSSRSQVRQTNL